MRDVSAPVTVTDTAVPELACAQVQLPEFLTALKTVVPFPPLDSGSEGRVPPAGPEAQLTSTASVLFGTARNVSGEESDSTPRNPEKPSKAPTTSAQMATGTSKLYPVIDEKDPGPFDTIGKRSIVPMFILGVAETVSERDVDCAEPAATVPVIVEPFGAPPSAIARNG